MKRDRFEEAADFALRIGRQQMGKMQQAGFPRLSDSEYADQVQAQQCEVGDVFLTQWLIVEMRPDQSQSSQRVSADSEFR